MNSELKFGYLCAKKFATYDKFINHKLCMCISVVIQMPFMQCKL